MFFPIFFFLKKENQVAICLACPVCMDMEEQLQEGLPCDEAEPTSGRRGPRGSFLSLLRPRRLWRRAEGTPLSRVFLPGHVRCPTKVNRSVLEHKWSCAPGPGQSNP